MDAHEWDDEMTSEAMSKRRRGFPERSPREAG